MKPLASSITPLPTTGAASAGRPLGATGSSELVPYARRDPSAYGTIPPGPLTKIVDASTSSLVNWLNMRRQLPSNVSKDEAEAMLARALDGARRALAPATAEEIAVKLEAIAQVFRAVLPEKTGLRIYIALLQEVPGLALDEACKAVVKTHAYPNLPLPNDILAAAKPTTATLEAWKRRLDIAAKHLAAL